MVISLAWMSFLRTTVDVVVADAIVKNVPNFDLKLAKDALIKDVRDFCVFSAISIYLCNLFVHCATLFIPAVINSFTERVYQSLYQR